MRPDASASRMDRSDRITAAHSSNAHRATGGPLPGDTTALRTRRRRAVDSFWDQDTKNGRSRLVGPLSVPTDLAWRSRTRHLTFGFGHRRTGTAESNAPNARFGQVLPRSVMSIR